MKCCSNCRAELSPGWRFCGNCGYPVKQDDERYSSEPIDPIAIVISHKIDPEKGNARLRRESYADARPFKKDEAVRIINSAIILIDEFNKAEPGNFSFGIIMNGLRLLSDRLTKGDVSPLSGAETNILELAANLFFQAAEVLLKEPSKDSYQEYIHKWIKICEDLLSLVENGLVVEHPIEKPTEKAMPKSIDVPSAGINNAIQEEIRHLEQEIGENAPQFKIHEYNPELDYWKELEVLIGLNNVKTQLQEHISAFRVHQVRKQMHPDLKTEFKFNCIFKGRPGTGKTTVARILSGILKQEGIIKTGQCVEADASSLISGWIGFTPKCTRLAALKAVGGVLLIDEAYSLITGKGGANNLGNEAIDALTPIMTNYADDLIVVLAGYEEEMDKFMSQVNTGFASRFQRNVDFEDYSGIELLKIFLNIAKNNYFRLDKRALQRLSKLLEAIAARKDSNRAFANARTVRSLFDAIRTKAAQRYMNDNKIDPDLITADDVTLTAQELRNIGAI